MISPFWSALLKGELCRRRYSKFKYRLQQLDMRLRLTVVLQTVLVATPAVIFWLWLVILRVRVAILCPEECWCRPGGYYVDCAFSGLNNIPLIFPTHVRELQIDGNNITSLENDSFISRGLIELEELLADRCGLETIEMGAFNGLTKFILLRMPRNEISEIKPGTFDNMNRLEKIQLQYNRIQYLDFDVFSGLINVKYIDLMHNKLQYLHPDTFVGLPNLEQLNLAENRDLQIPTDRHFINSHSLSRLYIWSSNVSSVSAETFANVTALEWLDLSYNNLSSVDINILKALPKLSALYLYKNPLQCDCQLQEVWRWCQDHNIERDFEFISQECDTTREVQGIWWGGLEKGQCLQDDIYYYGDYKNTSYSSTPTKDTDTDYDLHSDRFELLKRQKSHVYAALFTFGTTGNVILLIIILCNKDMRTVPNMYILNLAISDMIYLIVLFFEAGAVTIPDTWEYHGFTCTFFQFCRRLSVGLSAYSVAVLSIQRYRVTVNPLHVLAPSQQIWRATGATVCGVWIVAALFALPTALSGHLCDNCWSHNCHIYHQRVVLFELLVSCVLPLCVIAFCYIMTARHLLKSARPISEETQNPQLNTRKNFAKIVLGLTIVFLISYVPYHVFWTYVIFNELSDLYYDFSLFLKHGIDINKKYILEYTKFVSPCLLLVNPCLNPVALFCTCREIRTQLKRCLTCRCKANPTVSDIELTRTNLSL